MLVDPGHEEQSKQPSIKKLKEGESKMVIEPIGQIVSLDVYADASFCKTSIESFPAIFMIGSTPEIATLDSSFPRMSQMTIQSVMGL